MTETGTARSTAVKIRNVFLSTGFACFLLPAPISSVQAGWRDVMTHPRAAQQSTVLGRTLVELQRVGTSVHIGYGDYGANTGPIDLFAYLAPRGRLQFQGLRLKTEAILKIRRIRSMIFTISVDPQDNLTHNFAIANIRQPKQWRTGRGLSITSGSSQAAHLFDVVRYKDDLWMSGGMLNRRAGLWRSRNNGRSWELALEATAKSGFANDVSRFYFIGLHRNKLYVQGFDHCGGVGCSHRHSHVFNGNRWRTGPDLLRNRGMGYPADEFAGQMVFRTNENAFQQGTLLAFDGFSARDPLPWKQPIHDYTIGQDGYLYVLTADVSPRDGVNDQHILRSKDLDTWECIFDAPRRNTARSIEVVAVTTKAKRRRMQVYIGTTQSSLSKRWVRDRSNCDGWW